MSAAAGSISVRGGIILLGASALAFELVRGVLELPREAAGLGAVVHAHLPESGLQHPVSAVLLNFRGYDTWFELTILFLVLLGSLGMLQQRDLRHCQPPRKSGPVLTALVQALSPLMVLVAGYLLWLGKAAAGGAFQAGVVLAAAWVLQWYSGEAGPARMTRFLWRIATAAGVGGFLVAALVTLAGSGGLLEFPPAQASWMLVTLEFLATIAIGITLFALVIAPQNRPAS